MFGILGGTFDPIHVGHLHLAVALADRYQFSELGFFPAKQNPMKADAPGATAPQRLEMLKLALTDLADPRFRLFDWEVFSPTPSYSLLTVERCLQVGYRDIALILGNDAFAGFARWHEPKRLLESCNLVIATRTPVDFSTIVPILQSIGVASTAQRNRLVHSNGKWIEIAKVKPLPVSATVIRAQWARFWGCGGATPQGVTTSVSAYIKRNRMYAVISK